MRLRFLLLLFLSACSSNDVPKGVIPPDKMKVVLFDVMRADEFATNYISTDTTKNINEERIKLYETVFALHKTNKEAFYNSFDYYQKHPDQYKQLFDSLVAYTGRLGAKPDVPKPILLKTDSLRLDTLRADSVNTELPKLKLAADTAELKTN